MTTIKINNKNIEAENISDEWASTLMQKGVIVDLKISKWSGTASIKPEELGLTFSEDSQDFAKRYLSLGSEKLLPPEVTKEMNAITAKAKGCLDRHSFVTIWGNFVPYRAFPSWEEENEEIKKEFFQFAKNFGDKYDLIVDVVRKEYKKLGVDVWKRLYPDGGKPTEAFLSEFAENIVRKIPSAPEIVSKFKYNVIYYYIPSPSSIRQDIDNAREIARQTEKKDRQAQIEIDAKQKIVDEFVSRKTEIIDGFLNSTVGSMRKYIEDLCQSVLTSIGQENILDISRNHQKKIIQMIEKFRVLNFYDDQEINQLLNSLEFEVKKVKGEREKEVIVSTLQQIVEKTNEELNIGDFNPSIGYLDI